MIVHHNHVKLEIRFLRQGTLHGIGDGLLSVKHRNHHRSLVFKLLFVEIRQTVVAGVHQGTHLVKMLGTSLFHLNLHLTVSRVHIVKLLFAALSVIQFVLGIEELIQMEDFSHPTQIETQVVETGKLIFLSILLGDIVAQRLRLDEPEASEIEVISQTTLLIINHRMLFQFTRYFFRIRCIHFGRCFFGRCIILHQRIVVGVNHHRRGIIRRAQETLQGIEAPSDRGGLGANHHEVGIGIFGDALHGVATLQSVDNHEGTAVWHLMVGSEIGAHHQVDMLNSLVVMKFSECFLGHLQVFTWQEKVYFFSHFFVPYFLFFTPFWGLKPCFLSLFQLIILKYVAKITIFRQKTLSLQYE